MGPRGMEDFGRGNRPLVEKCCELGLIFTGSAAGGGARRLFGRNSGTLGIWDAESREERSSSGDPRFPRPLASGLPGNSVSRLFDMNSTYRSAGGQPPEITNLDARIVNAGGSCENPKSASFMCIGVRD